MAYRVTVRERKGRWVAFDKNGDWRAYCKKHFAKTALEAVAMMYHLDEAACVEDHGETAEAIILDGTERKEEK